MAHAKSSNLACDVERAMEVFAGGFAFTRCFTYPCEAKKVGKLWRICDQARTRASSYRNEEWVAFNVPPKKADAAARKGTRGRFSVCAIRAVDQPDDGIRADYRALGYRLRATEALMVHRLGTIKNSSQPFPVMRVTTNELADRIANRACKRQILPEHLGHDTPLRLYAAVNGDKPIGWVRSITVGDSNWVSNVYVLPAFRRQGVGRAMLSTMLREDRALGSKQSVLLASHAGELLYDAMGYEKVGELLLYAPPAAVMQGLER